MKGFLINSSMLNKWWWSISQQKVIDILLMILNSVETHFPAVGRQMIWISLSTKKVSIICQLLLFVTCVVIFSCHYNISFGNLVNLNHIFYLLLFQLPQAHASSCSKAKSFTYFMPYISYFDTRCESNVLQSLSQWCLLIKYDVSHWWPDVSCQKFAVLSTKFM